MTQDSLLPTIVLTPPVHTHQVTMEAIDQHRMREKVREMKPSIKTERHKNSPSWTEYKIMSGPQNE